ncbi:MAG TPA: DNA polymerase III subunit delta [Pirellulaceae bacterium]|nr:DNA polymerase III subunit delta [Pirellulaceae bacterium]
MDKLIHVFDFLDRPTPQPLPALVVLAGGQRYLTWLALHHLRGNSAADGDWSEVQIDVSVATWAEVADELAAKSLFDSGAKRLILDDADSFITNHREKLEDILRHPANGNTLVLTASKWLKTTRLHKQIKEHGLLVECSPPMRTYRDKQYVDEKRVADWLVARAVKSHGFKLSPAGAKRLVELTDGEFGRMDQELAKIALSVTGSAAVTADQVQQIVGGWQLQTVWKIADAAADGQVARAMYCLNQLFQAEQDAIGIFAQISWSLRRFGLAFEHHCRAQRKNPNAPLFPAMTAAGFQFDMDANEARYRRIGPQRLAQITQRLLDADLALKRTHSRDNRGRLVIENLVVWLADGQK